MAYAKSLDGAYTYVTDTISGYLGAVAGWINSEKSALYEMVEEGKFTEAAKYMQSLQDEELYQQLYSPYRGRNVIQLIVSRDDHADSVQLLDEIAHAVANKPNCKLLFEDQQIFTYALRNGKEQLFCHLLNHPAYLDEEQIKTCLSIIATCGYYTANERLLEVLNGKKENQIQSSILGNENLDSPFFKAVGATRRNVPGASAVLTSFIKVLTFENWRSNTGETVLHILSHNKAAEALELLSILKPTTVQVLADEMEEEKGRTALAVAATVNDALCIRHLLRMGADYTLLTHEGKTPHQLTRKAYCCSPCDANEELWMAEHGLFEIDPAVASGMADKVRERREKGFLLSCLMGTFPAARMSIENYGVDINAVDRNGNNALTFALYAEKDEEVILSFIQFLIDKGIDLTRSRENALTALERGFNTTAALLIQADPSAQQNALKRVKKEEGEKESEGYVSITVLPGEGSSRNEGPIEQKLMGSPLDFYPIRTREEKRLTAEYLNNHPEIEKLVDVLTGEHLQLLDKEHFLSPAFPWVKFVGQSEKLAAMLPIDSKNAPFQTEKTLEILQKLDIDVIRLLIGDLSAQHLRNLSKAQFRKEGFPWKELAQYPDKVKEMFSTSATAIDQTKRLSKLLEPETIALLIAGGGLTWEEHGSYFSDSQREKLSK